MSGEGDAVVESRALLERATDGFHDLPEGAFVHALAVRGARGSRDVLVHQRAAEVVGPGLQNLPGAAGSDLHPRHLNVGDPGVVRDATDTVHEQRFAERRATPRLALQV